MEEPVTQAQVERLFSEVKELFSKGEERVDSIETLFANLMMGYAELAIAVESLMNHMVGSMTPEAKQKFAVDTLEARQQMLSMLNKAATEGDPEAKGLKFDEVADTFFGKSVQRMAEGDQA